jgi:hypothetical protein
MMGRLELASKSFICSFNYLMFGETRLFKKTMMTIAVALLVTCYFYAALLLPTYAEQNDENVAVGVKVGDWIKYDFTHVGVWSPWENDWTRVEVKNVSGTNIVIHVSTEYSVSHDRMAYVNATLNIDVKENWIEEHPPSPYDLLYDMPYVIAGNLSLSDHAFQSLVEKLSNYTVSEFAWNYSVNYGMVSRKYGEVVREVLIINQSYEMRSFGYVMKVYDEFCWDRITGLLLEQKSIGNMPETATNVTMAQFMQIRDTNLWEMLQPSTLWIQVGLGVTLPIAVIAVIVIVPKKATKRKQDLKNGKS